VTWTSADAPTPSDTPCFAWSLSRHRLAGGGTTRQPTEWGWIVSSRDGQLPSCRTSPVAQCHAALVLPNLDAVFELVSPEAGVIAAVFDSARLIPKGYAAVPDVRGLVDDADIEAALGRVDLAWTPRCPPSMQPCELAPLAATIPSAGNVVPMGTAVSEPDPPGSDAEQAARLPAAPAGTRWVGLNGVMVAVPASWSVNDTRCGQPLADTVDFDDSRFADDCFVPGSERHSVLRPLALSSARGRQWQGVEGSSVDLGGLGATRVGDGGCLASDPPQCSGLLAVPGLDVVFVVKSRESAEEVDAILDSALLIPEGHTAVPDLRDGDPEALLRDVGLALPSPQPDFPHSVTGSLPVAGSVVPVGSEVALVIAEG